MEQFVKAVNICVKQINGKHLLTLVKQKVVPSSAYRTCNNCWYHIVNRPRPHITRIFRIQHRHASNETKCLEVVGGGGMRVFL